MATVQCPECRKALKLGNVAVGLRVRCPGCQFIFVVREPKAAADNRDDEPRGRPKRRPPRSEDEDDDEKPSKRRQAKDVEQEATPVIPMLYAILSCVLFCTGPVGVALGSLAVAKAGSALNELPSGKRGRNARKNMQLAKNIGYVGIGVSFAAGIGALILNLTGTFK